MSTICYPRDIAPKLYGELERITRGTSAPPFAPLPTPSEIADLLDACFFASLIEEEGRRTTFTLAFVDPEVVAEDSSFKIFRFKEPLSLRPKDLAKLAPAAASERTFLAVWRNEKGHLNVWGIIQKYGDTSYDIDLEQRGTCLRVQVLRSGTLTVHYLEQPILLFSSGYVRFFDKQIPLESALIARACLIDDEERIAHTLCLLARRMVAHGHGGAILVVDNNYDPVNLTMHGSYTDKISSNRFLVEAATKYQMALEGKLPRQEMKEDLRESARDVEKVYVDALDFIGRLTAVDGATVLRKDLTLLGFGAKIATPKNDEHEPEIEEQDPYSSEGPRRVALSSFPGTRHRSAIQFCASQPGGLAAALVASQDGDFSLFVRQEERIVYALRPYVLGIGIIPGTSP